VCILMTASGFWFLLATQRLVLLISIKLPELIILLL
jgi:hypothetical protein